MTKELSFPIFTILYLIGVGLGWWHFGSWLFIAIIGDLLINPLYRDKEE